MPPDASIVLLVRHAHTDAIGQRLIGRMRGVPLGDSRRAQPERLGRALVSERLAAIYTSPLERARETADAIGRYQRAPRRVDDALTEVDFGEWTRQTFGELETLLEWRTFNSARGSVNVPGASPLHTSSNGSSPRSNASPTRTPLRRSPS